MNPSPTMNSKREREQTAQATKEELEAQRIRCWNPNCRNRAWLEDGMGWRWCLKHWWRSYYWGGGEVSLRSFIYQLKSTKVFI
jgi:hypothetical protein